MLKCAKTCIFNLHGRQERIIALSDPDGYGFRVNIRIVCRMYVHLIICSTHPAKRMCVCDVRVGGGGGIGAFSSSMWSLLMNTTG